MKYKVFPVTFDTTGVTLFDCKNIVNGLKKNNLFLVTLTQCNL